MDEALTHARLAVVDLQQRAAWAMSSEESVFLIDRVQVLTTQLTVVQATHIRELEGRGYPAKHGATSVGAWLRDRLRISIHAAQRLVALGAVMEQRPRLADSLRSGDVMQNRRPRSPPR